MRRALRVLGRATAAAAAIYGGYVAVTYLRFGRAPARDTADSLLDRLMPAYDVRERHSRRVSAPPGVTLAAAGAVSLQDSPVVRAILGLRALPGRLRGGRPADADRRPMLDEVRQLGWRELAEQPGRQLAMGAVTQPWRQEVRFRGLPAEAFLAFDEPGYAKIAWTLEAEPAGASACVFSTETRVLTTDPVSRERFRRYWALLSPGILTIRHEMLRLVKAEAEGRWRATAL